MTISGWREDEIEERNVQILGLLCGRSNNAFFAWRHFTTIHCIQRFLKKVSCIFIQCLFGGKLIQASVCFLLVFSMALVTVLF